MLRVEAPDALSLMPQPSTLDPRVHEDVHPTVLFGNNPRPEKKKSPKP